MSRIIIHRRKSGKYDYTITGDDVNENILVATVQGFDRKAAVIKNLDALFWALYDDNITYMTHAQYTEWRRKNRNQLRRNARARKRT